MSIGNKTASNRVLALAAGIAFFLSGSFMTAAETDPEDGTMLIVDFGADATPWPNVDDAVMGGVSSSRMRMEADTAVFEGTLSLENNGGFASVRSNDLEPDLTGYKGIRVRVKGDGNAYQFRIRTGFDRANYQHSFDTTKDEWTEVDLPLSAFDAAFRGQALPDHPPIDPAKITSMGFLIADKQEGQFRLEIDWVRAYPAGPVDKSNQ